MKITIIFPGRSLETARATGSVMPLAPCLLAALTPREHKVSLVDMFMGDGVDYESDSDVIALTVRTPLATIAYDIADRFLARGKKVLLGGPHTFAFPEEAKRHATAVAIGEGGFQRLEDEVVERGRADAEGGEALHRSPLEGRGRLSRRRLCRGPQ